MYSTSEFQKKQDFYKSKQECIEGEKKSNVLMVTNERYNFKHRYFTAGDEEQFELYRDKKTYNICEKQIDLSNNIFSNLQLEIWKKNKDITSEGVSNTFKYIFNKMKKGIFIKIVNNKLKVFLPFTNTHYVNEWSNKIKVDPERYNSIKDFIYKTQSQKGYNKNEEIQPVEEWVGNNCLLKYDGDDGDSHHETVKNLFDELCSKRTVPDIELFVNRRDFPYIKKDETEAYDSIWGKKQLLVSHNYEKYCPILSMSKTSEYSDVLFPTWDDWSRVQREENIYFSSSCNSDYSITHVPWENKIPTAIFRGSYTGCGTTDENNVRLKLAKLSSETNLDENGVKYLDAGLTNIQLRFRKNMDSEYLESINYSKYNQYLVNKMSKSEQAKYKYVINVDGHVSAFRLSLELGSESLILLVSSEWKIWYSDMLVEYEHYVPIKSDLSDLVDRIKWCRENDEKCQKIVKNAKDFYNKYLSKKSMLDYMQKLCVSLKQEMGLYIYDSISLISIQNNRQLEELKNIQNSFPRRSTLKIYEIPNIERCYGKLKGIEWVINMLIENNLLSENLKYNYNIMNKEKEKGCLIDSYNLSNFKVIAKSVLKGRKDREIQQINECFVGMKCMNEMSKYIPNFAYIFGNVIIQNESILLEEEIDGFNFEHYLRRDPNFNIQDYFLILTQIALSLEMAQNKFNFQHGNLTCHHVMIKKNSENNFRYLLDGIFYNISNNSNIPVIVDYRNSNVVVDSIFYGYPTIIHFDQSKDLLSLFFDSLILISKFRNLGENKSIIDFTNQLLQKDFKSIKEIVDWINDKNEQFIFSTNREHRYNKTFVELINSKKYVNLENYITVKDRCLLLFRGNERQVFDYILSPNVQGRIESFLNIFKILKKSSIPRYNNLFLLYLCYQNIQSNIMDVYGSLVEYLESNGIKNDYSEYFTDVENFIHIAYGESIRSNYKDIKPSHITYNIPEPHIDNFNTRFVEDYIFSDPSEFKKYIEGAEPYVKKDYSDLYLNLEIYYTILLNGKYFFEISDNTKRFFKDDFSKYLSLSNYQKTNVAKFKTIKEYGKILFEERAKYLKGINLPCSNESSIKAYNNSLILCLEELK